MLNADGSLLYNMRDIYPSYGGEETSTQALPDADDMSALAENEKDAVNNGRGASGKNIVIAVIIMVAAVVFLGGGK